MKNSGHYSMFNGVNGFDQNLIAKNQCFLTRIYIRLSPVDLIELQVKLNDDFTIHRKFLSCPYEAFLRHPKSAERLDYFFSLLMIQIIVQKNRENHARVKKTSVLVLFRQKAKYHTS